MTSLLAKIGDFTYGLPLWLRWKMYRHNMLKRSSLPHPVISIGSIVLGGAGKTPMTALLAKKLLALGKKPVVLTRGYGRIDTSRRITVYDGNCEWRMCGDEPLLLSKKLPKVPIVVHKNRYISGLSVENEVDIYILDDGFQHISLHRDIDIVILLGNEHHLGLLPLGARRDGLWRIKHLGEKNHAIVSIPDDQNDNNRMEQLLELLPKNIPIARHRTVASAVHPVSNWENKEAPSMLSGRNVLLTSGIARPDRFAKTVRSLKANIVRHIVFRDHRFCSKSQMEQVIKEAQKYNAEIILTTEKDAVRIAEFAPKEMMALTIELELVDNTELERILSKL